jgi:hypothetical protein
MKQTDFGPLVPRSYQQHSRLEIGDVCLPTAAHNAMLALRHKSSLWVDAVEKVLSG